VNHSSTINFFYSLFLASKFSVVSESYDYQIKTKKQKRLKKSPAEINIVKIPQQNTHTPYICGFALSDMEHGCMVYTGLAPRRLQFHVAPAMPVL